MTNPKQKLNVNGDILASLWWSTPIPTRERLLYQAHLNYGDNADRRWMELEQATRNALAPLVHQLYEDEIG